jgi:hypothetical protein
VLFQLERCCFGCEFCLPFPYLGVANLDPIYVKFMCQFYAVICSVFMSNFIQIIYSRLLLSRAISESAWYVNGEGSRGSCPQSCPVRPRVTDRV